MSNQSQNPLEGRLAVSAAEAGRILGIGPTTLHHETRSGRLPSFMIGGRRLYRVETLRQYVDALSSGELVAAASADAPSQQRGRGRPRKSAGAA